MYHTQDQIIQTVHQGYMRQLSRGFCFSNGAGRQQKKKGTRAEQEERREKATQTMHS